MADLQSDTRTTVSIENTGTIVEQAVLGDALVSINIEGDATADYALDVSHDGDTWIENEETYSGTDIRDAFRFGDRHLRIRVTSAAGGGDEATITIQEAR
jgi:hypothetical protein